MELERKIYSLLQLATSLENFFLKNFASNNYWVTAEITKVSQKGGHYYFELADSDNGELFAQFNAYFWFGNHKKCVELYGSSINDVIQTGNKILLLVKIDYHKIFGLKLNILNIDPNYSYGEMERQKIRTVEQLKSEGLYYLQKQLTFKQVSRKIALISSPDTSGYRDFMVELTENNLYTHFQIKLFPTAVQGIDAKGEIIKQIKEAQKHNVDAIVIIRGGGSKTDLNVFNDYDLCKTICLCRIPIITGIGHETDDVVAAHVSRLDCITPTAAAKHFYIQISSYMSDLRSAFDQVLKQSLILLQAHNIEFYDLQKRLGFWSNALYQNNRMAMDELTHHLTRLVQFNILNKYQDLDILLMQIDSTSKQQISVNQKIHLPALVEQLRVSSIYLIQEQKNAVNQLDLLFSKLNPIQLLNKGYTLTQIAGEDINHIENLTRGDVIQTRTSKVIIESKIEHIKNI